MRLTNRDGTYTELILDSYKGIECHGQRTMDNELTHKLGQLEDIEEEIGIDLKLFVSLFKTKKIYVKSGYCCEAGEVFDLDDYQTVELISFDSTSEEVPDYAKDFANNWHLCFYVVVSEYESTLYMVNIKDYGKTWALTKEELE